MTRSLHETCELLLIEAVRRYGGAVYREITFRKRPYRTFDLLWDGPDQILLIACCWDEKLLPELWNEVDLFFESLPLLGVHKKLHLVLVHYDGLRTESQTWLAGISYTPIALPGDYHPDQEPPEWFGDKLGSLFDWLPPEVAATLQAPADWRKFLTREEVMAEIRRLTEAQGSLPTDWEDQVERLLQMAENPVPDLRQRVRAFLDEHWGKRS